MKIAIMQPYLYPYIGYFQLMHAVDLFVMLDNVSFINKGWINRNRILVDGHEHIFTMPLEKASQNKMIRDIRISPDNSWKTKFLKTIEQNYKRAPLYKPVFELLSKHIRDDETLLNSYIHSSICAVNDYLGIDTKIIQTSSIYENDQLKAEHKIIDICKKEYSDHYINPIGGIALYNKSFFLENGIRINFLKSGDIRYKQSGDPFIPNLSIIDVLMFNSPSVVKTMLKNYSLV